MIGQVTMEDGTPPPKSVGILRVCDGGTTVETRTDKNGRFVMKRVSSGGIEDFDRTSSTTDAFNSSSKFGASVALRTNCVLRASLSGYISNTIDLKDPRVRETPYLPPFILKRGESAEDAAEGFVRLPKATQKEWDSAMKAMGANNWPEAEHRARQVTQQQPRFTQGWRLLGAACMNQEKTADARQALEQAITLRPKMLSTHMMLTRLNANAKDWEGVAKAATRLLALDTGRRYQEAQFLLAVAQYHLKDYEQSEKSLRALIEKAREMPRVEYMLGLVRIARKDNAGAADYLKRYIEIEPKASEAERVNAWLAHRDKPDAVPVVLEADSIDLTLPAPGAVWVPGGMKALAIAAHISRPYTSDTFFSVYSDALVRGGEPGSLQSISGYQGTLADYFSTVSELAQAGERQTGKTIITLSLATPEKRSQAARILPLLGWKLAEEAGTPRVELGGNIKEAARQAVPALLGINELAMQEALEGGHEYKIEIVSESVRLMGGDAWAAMLPANLTLAGGLTEAFARDLRLPKLYSALEAMGNDTASALVEAVGLRNLAGNHANLLWKNAEAFRLVGSAAAAPGGGNAMEVWTRLVGPSPRDAKGFYHALFGKDRGRMAGFYAMVAGSDAAHQRFLTRSAEDAAAYYAMFRDPYLMIRPGDTPRGTWPPRHYQELPLSADGKLRFPGSRLSWTNSAALDAKLLPDFGSPEALIAAARLEAARKTPLDAACARALARHFTAWRGLFQYFERLPGLSGAQFTALESFEAAMRKIDPVKRNHVMGEWHSLVELIALGTESGTFDAATGARLFERVCRELSAGESPARTMAILRDMTGQAADLDAAIPEKILRLEGEKRTAYDRIRGMQKIPRLDERNRAQFLTALSGIVYAARLNPQFIVLREDAEFSRRHRFADNSAESPVFLPSVLRLSSAAPGSYFAGGFAGFIEAARKLAVSPAQPFIAPGQLDSSEKEPTTSFAKAATQEGVAVFSTDARLVEVHATVTDDRGRYLDNLKADSFEIIDEGKAQSIKAFEPSSAGLSCALLLDTTGSMEAALPALKNAALRLLGELREEDSVAVYSFSDVTLERQAFTKNKRAAKRAVLPAYPHGRTALYDAVAEVAYAISGRSGKKVIVVFTDGDDNQSSVTAEHAIRRAKLAGVPVYTIAQGAALNHPALLAQLTNISTTTGGLSFSIREPRQIQTVFEKVAGDLKHGYLLAYQPPDGKPGEWRKIEVQIKGVKGHKVRARDGYFQ